MEEYREKTKEELAEEYRIEDEQRKLIEDNADDLEFLHKKAEEIFYNKTYDDWPWDSLFYNTIWRIRDHHNPSSLPVLLRLCDDDRFWDSVFQEGWMKVFAFGYEREDLCREYFAYLHKIFPQAPGMGASIYSILVLDDIEFQKKYVLLARPEAFRELCQMFLEAPDLGGIPFLWADEEDLDLILENVRALEKYYDDNRMKVV